MASAYEREPVRESFDARIAKLAARQYGVFTRSQAIGNGASSGMVQRRMIKGRWERVHPGVYRLAGAPPSRRQALLAACLAWGPGAVVSHRSAAALWQLPGFEQATVELSVPRGRDRRGPGIVHRPLRLPPVDVTSLRSIPVTTPARTLLDIAAISSPGEIEEALDDALRRKLVSLPRLRWRLAETRRRGRGGVVLLGALIDSRDHAGLPQSVLETRVLRLLDEAGLPRPLVQYEVRDRAVLCVVDFAFPDCRLAIEAEGYRWHTGRLRFEHDLARRNVLTALGWKVIHVTWTDVTERSGALVASIVRAMELPPGTRG